MTTTRATLRRRLSEAIGDWISGTATSDGNASGTTIVDTNLETYTEVDDGIQGWVHVTSGTHIGKTRRILVSGGYTQVDWTITVSNAFAASKVASGVTYEIHRIDPAYKHAMIDRAIEELFPLLYLPIIDQSNVAHSLLTDGGFEQWTSATDLTQWTAAGSAVQAQITSTLLFSGKSCLELTYVGAGSGVYQDVTPMQGDTDDAQVTIGCWVWAATASLARIGFSFDAGSNYTYSDYHAGKNEWEWLEKVVDVPTPTATVGYRFLCSVASAGAVYFDQAMVHFGQKRKRYPIISTILLGPHFVSQQAYASLGDGPYYSIPRGGLVAGRSLRLEGMGLLTRPATDALTTEVDGARVNLIVAKAAHNLYRSMYSRSTGDSRNEYRELVDYWATEVDALSRRPGVRMSAMPAEIPDGWHVEEDSGGRYLVFD